MTDAGLPLRTLPELLKRSAELYAARPALSEARAETGTDAGTITYRELYDAVSAMSAKLAADGIGFGDSVAVLAENSPNWGMAYLAITCMGAVAVPILTEFHSDAIAHIIRHSGAKAIFVSQRMSCKIADASLDASLLRIDIETMAVSRFGQKRDGGCAADESCELSAQDSTEEEKKMTGGQKPDAFTFAQDMACETKAEAQGALHFVQDKAREAKAAAGAQALGALHFMQDRARGAKAAAQALGALQFMQDRAREAKNLLPRELFEPGGGKEAEKIPRKEPEETDPAAIIYTSGTSGHSKGVVLSHKNIIANALCVQEIVPLYAGDRMISILPLPHAFECTLGFVLPLMHGVHIHYPGKTPALRALLPVLAKVRPTVMLAVPLIMEKIFKVHVLPKLRANFFSRLLYALPPVRKILHRAAGKKLLATFGGELRTMAIGGAPIAPDAETFLREAGFPYAMGYGLTEASPLLSGAGPGKTRLGSAGCAVPGTSLRLGKKNEKNGTGEIEAKGPSVMLGYFNQPDLTQESFTEDGWLKTGDLADMDEDGYIYIRGRSKNAILGPSGENIYPEEVESFFFASPFVLEALVYRQEGKLCARAHMDAARMDEALKGLPGKEAMKKRRDILEEIRAQVNSRVSGFARIAKITEQAEPFEKTATQKIKRYLYVDSQA